MWYFSAHMYTCRTCMAPDLFLLGHWQPDNFQRSSGVLREPCHGGQGKQGEGRHAKDQCQETKSHDPIFLGFGVQSVPLLYEKNVNSTKNVFNTFVTLPVENRSWPHNFEKMFCVAPFCRHSVLHHVDSGFSPRWLKNPKRCLPRQHPVLQCRYQVRDRVSVPWHGIPTRVYQGIWLCHATWLEHWDQCTVSKLNSFSTLKWIVMGQGGSILKVLIKQNTI